MTDAAARGAEYHCPGDRQSNRGDGSPVRQHGQRLCRGDGQRRGAAVAPCGILIVTRGCVTVTARTAGLGWNVACGCAGGDGQHSRGDGRVRAGV